MHRFNFERSFALASVKKLSRGMLEIRTMFQGSFSIRKSSVRMTTTKRLSDSSLRVVDLGPRKKGKPPVAAIIAAGAKYRLPQL